MHSWDTITVYHYIHSMRILGLSHSRCFYRSPCPLGQNSTSNLISDFTCENSQRKETKDLTGTVENSQRACRREANAWTELTWTYLPIACTFSSILAILS